MKPIETIITKILNKKTNRYFNKYSRKFIYKNKNINILKYRMSEEKEEEIRDRDAMEEEKDDIYKGLGATFSSLININEEDKPGEKEKELISFKRKRAKKERKSILGSARKVKKVEPSSAQKVFNILSQKEVIDEPAVRSAAAEAKYDNITSENIQFFIGLGKARATLRKFGIPGTICRSPFHLFVKFLPYDTTNVFTNDTNVINAYYWLLFTKEDPKVGGLKEYKSLCKDSIIKDFSVVTDKTFICDKVLSGYVQDNSKKASLICPKELTQKEIETFSASITNKEAGSISVTIESPSGNKIYFLQYKEILITAPEELDINTALAETANVRCVNSKNNLQSGLKDVKFDTNLGSFLNVHDMKTTDFSPSCLFINPAVEKPKMFLNVELETNSVYDVIVKQMEGIEKLVDLKLPEGTIFWDNLESISQMLAFIKLINKVNKKLETEMLYVISMHQQYRQDFTIWRRLYSNFETIVLSFYDKITNKLAIDAITSLADKVSKFISDFNNEKLNSGAYSSILKILDLLPGTKMMKNFIGTNFSIELIYSIARLIAMLKLVSTEGTDVSMSELFKTIGLTCANVLYDGAIAMIPKIRAKSAFVGGLMSDMKKEEYDKNINYLVNTYKKNYAASLKDESVKLDDINEIDDLVKVAIRNTIENSDSDYLKTNILTVTNKIIAEPELFPRLRENIIELKKKNTSNQIRLNGDFAADDGFMSYLKALDSMNKAIVNAGGEADIDYLSNAVKAGEEKEEDKTARIKKFKNSLGREKKKKPIFEFKKVPKKKNAVKFKKEKFKNLFLVSHPNKEKEEDLMNNFEIIIKDNAE